MLLFYSRWIKMTYIRAKDRIGTTVNGFKILDTKRENRRTYLYIICPYCEEKKWMRVEDVISNKCVSCGCYNIKYNLRNCAIKIACSTVISRFTGRTSHFL